MKHLVNIDLNQNELQNAVVQPLATAPSSGKLGQIYYNSTDKKTYQYNGTAWVAIGITDVATTSANGLMSSSDKTKLNGIATGAEVNQNAFSNVKVGSTTVAADAKTDTLELVAGSNVTLTPDATNDKVTIAATDTTYSVVTAGTSTTSGGLMSQADKTKLNGIATGAEVNQNAFSNVTVGSTTIAADAKTDTLTLAAGSNVTLTPDATNDKVTIAATDTTYSAGTQALLEAGTDTANRVWQPKILHDYISSTVGAADAMRFKGTIGTGGTVTSLPESGVKIGDTYRVITAGTYAGQTCEIGDLIIAIETTPAWTVAQTNIDGAITSISGTAPITVSGSGSSRTIAISAASGSAAGSMSKAHYTKLEGIAAGAEVNQNAFSNVTVGSTTIAADAKTDTLTLAAGTNITLTPDATNDKVTIATSAEVNQNAFSNVKVGSTTVAADTKTDTLELAAGTNITLTPDATNDKVTIATSAQANVLEGVQVAGTDLTISSKKVNVPKATDSQWGVVKVRNGNPEGTNTYMLGITRSNGSADETYSVPTLDGGLHIDDNVLPASGVTAGTYDGGWDSKNTYFYIPTYTVDAKGRITAASETTKYLSKVTTSSNGYMPFGAYTRLNSAYYERVFTLYGNIAAGDTSHVFTVSGAGQALDASYASLVPEVLSIYAMDGSTYERVMVDSTFSYETRQDSTSGLTIAYIIVTCSIASAYENDIDIRLTYKGKMM